MNNKTPLILNGVLAFAIIILFYLQLSGPAESHKEQSGSATTEEPDLDTTTNNFPKSGLTIAYVNSDTLTKYYDYNKKLSKELMEKQASAEGKLKNMYAQYQAKVEKYQKEAPIMGEEELQRKQMEIMQMEQDISAKEQELSNSLADKNYSAQMEYMLTTDKYTQKIGKKLGYDFIIGYRTGDLVMYANPELDITQKVIKMLNEEYMNDTTRED